MQTVSRYILNGVTQESKKCNVFAFKCPWTLSDGGAEWWAADLWPVANPFYSVF